MLRSSLTSLKGYLDLRTPGYLVFFVTSHCNCRCGMCFYSETIDQATNRQLLSIEEIERFARNFPGLHNVNLSGGEPFLREDLAEIPSLFYRHSGTRFFSCATNSSLPERAEAVVAAMCTACPQAWIRITQSLDAVGSLHDAIRGNEGLFERVVDLNERLARLTQRFENLSVGIVCVLSSLNRGREYELLDYAYSHLQFQDFGCLLVRGETRDPTVAPVEPAAYRQFQQACIARSRRRDSARALRGRAFAAVHQAAAQLLMDVFEQDRCVTPCLAGRRMVVMDDEGEIQPCEVLEHFIRQGRIDLETAHLGNIRDFDYDIRRVLATDYARRVVRTIVDSQCYCTYECAMAANVIYTPRLWPRVLGNLSRL